MYVKILMNQSQRRHHKEVVSLTVHFQNHPLLLCLQLDHKIQVQIQLKKKIIQLSTFTSKNLFNLATCHPSIYLPINRQSDNSPSIYPYIPLITYLSIHLSHQPSQTTLLPLLFQQFSRSKTNPTTFGKENQTLEWHDL